LTADLNPAFAGKSAAIGARVVEVRRKRADVGGRCQDWTQVLTEGAGMEVRASSSPTSFLVRDWASRIAEQPDAQFYTGARMVAHLDRQARTVVRELYGELLSEGVDVLDLMSSVVSHLPEDKRLGRVTGLGMNAEELAANPVLDERVVHDLNADPRLPFGDRSFDAVVNTSSVEYLTRPLEVFAEVARVLKTGGVFVVTFSNRWFPPKVIKVWRDAHPGERIGLVLEYFLLSDAFSGLETLSVEGYPRPADDPHIGETDLADPVFAVWGRKR
jgi:SAM-dependent methyltransferase